MKLLFDQNISFRIEKKLPAIFSESKHISSVGLMNVNDIDIWNYAKKECFKLLLLILTFMT